MQTPLFVVFLDGEDLIKAHVRAHFRRDPVTGKLIFIKDYDNSKHAHLVAAEFHKGDEVEITQGKNAGKIGKIRSFNDKEHRLSVVFSDGSERSFTPDNIKMRTPGSPRSVQSGTPPSSSVPSPAPTPGQMSLDDIKKELGLVGLSWSHSDMVHETKRVSTMTDAQLEARIKKVKGDQKLYNYYRALDQAGKSSVADKVLDELRTRAEVKKKLGTPQKPVPAQKTDADKVKATQKAAADAIQNKHPSDFFHDKQEAYAVAPQEYRDVCNAVGILPVDDDACKYMTDNIQLLQQQAAMASSASNGGVPRLPRWARGFSTAVALDYYFSFKFSHSSGEARHGKTSPLDLPASEWMAQGYSESEVKKVQDEAMSLQNEVKPFVNLQYTAAVFDRMMGTVLATNGIGSASSRSQTYSKSKYNLDTPVDVILKDQEFGKLCAMELGREWVPADFNSDTAISIARVVGGTGPGQQTTVRKYYENYLGKYSVVGHNSQRLKELSDKIRGAIPEVEQAAVKFGQMQDSLKSSGYYNYDDWSVIFFDRSARSIYSDQQDIIKSLLNGTSNRTYESEIFGGNIYCAQQYTSRKFVHFLRTNADESIINNLDANAMAAEGLYRKRNNPDFKPFILPAKLFSPSRTGKQLGYMMSNRKGELSDIQKRIVKQFDANKGKKLGGKRGAPPAPVSALFRKVDQSVFDQTVKKIAKSWDTKTHSNIDFTVHGIYQVGGMDTYEDFKNIEKEKDNVEYHYHATHFAAGSSIVKGGYKIMKKAKAGRAFGDGIYTTPVASKSAQPCYLRPEGYNYHGPRAGVRGVLFLNKVSLGKQYVVNKTPGYSMNGFDSKKDPGTVGSKGGRFINEEHVVFNPKAVSPMYWVDIELVPHGQGYLKKYGKA